MEYTSDNSKEKDYKEVILCDKKKKRDILKWRGNSASSLYSTKVEKSCSKKQFISF